MILTPKSEVKTPVGGGKAQAIAGKPVLPVAQSYVGTGLSVIPVRADGTKAPKVTKWKPYQEKRPTKEELCSWFGNDSPVGMAIICGRVSKNLEVIDIDDASLIPKWKREVRRLKPGLLAKLTQVRTPSGGLHIYYRCRTIEGNQKLAQRNSEDPLFKEKPTLIETRGEGGYVVAPGSHDNCHEKHQPYRHVGGPKLTNIPRITAGERQTLLMAARSLNRKVEVVTGKVPSVGDALPGDDFNRHASWKDILQPHGWKCEQNGKTILWRRPGKNQGSSATSGYCRNDKSGDLFYVFSSNAPPFKDNRAYSKFAAYTLLNHEEDFKAAATALRAEGYGQSQPSGADEDSSGPYEETDTYIVWWKRTGRKIEGVPLTNFKARIVAEVVHDDGAEQHRYYEIEAVVNGRTSKFQVAADQFGSMRWVAEHLGPSAVLSAGSAVKDHTRAAIQVLSRDIKSRIVYRHTGWRSVEKEGWVYLNAGGAIGRVGRVSGVDIALDDALSRFALPEPPRSKRRLAKAVRASIRLLDLAPRVITVPLYCAIWRAVLKPCDFTVHLSGETGVGKTEDAALVQQHWGAELNARNLPASWSSTGNALEGLSFIAKDAVLVVDDFSPVGSQTDINALNREASRLLRAQGNRSGRLRMRHDTSLRPAKYPRGLVVSTGEEIPRKQSIQARLLVVDIEPQGEGFWNRLTKCQADARAGLYAEAMAGFVKWVANRYEEAQRQLQHDADEWRRQITTPTMHRRTAPIIAGLLAGLRQFLDYAKEVGAIDDDQKSKLLAEALEALTTVAIAQVRHQEDAEPTRRFLAALAGSLASGRAHVAKIDGTTPLKPEIWGWRSRSFGKHSEWYPQGQLIGWVQRQDLYLEPEAALAVAQSLTRDSGDVLAVSLSTLKRRLKDKGLLASRDKSRETLTIRKTLQGQRREVIHIRTRSLFPIEQKPDQPDQGSGKPG
ncbi:MAG: bifunctional DNA primase/polymerase [Planctomycetota bacterium]|jgi:hypothetical protein